MNKTVGIILAVFAAILIGVGGWYFITHDKLIGLEEEIDAQFAKVETQLQRRFDLIPNLINATKGYMEHEKEVFTSIAESRSKLSGATSVNDKVTASNELQSALSRLLMVTENYPELKADAQFTALMDELAGTENRISTERNRYNDAVKNYNKEIRKSFKSIVANNLGMEEREYFKANESANEAPVVSFD